MRYAIVDCRLSTECAEGLEGHGYTLVPMPPFCELDGPVSSHPDMLMFFGDRIYCHRRYLPAAREQLALISEASGFALTASDEPTGRRYPLDVLFNAAEIGNHLICRKASVSRLVLDYAAARGLVTLNVGQGYAKCSVCKVSDNAIITSDRGIADAARGAGIKVLTVRPGHVALDGYDCGFIGGASGSDDDNVYFCGDVLRHPDGEAICDFCRSNGKNAISLSGEPLYDYGSIFFI